jgi:protein SCO1/2
LPAFRNAAAAAFTAGLFLSAGAAIAKPQPFDARGALNVSQAAVGNKLAALRFTDSRKRPVNLVELMDKPLVISLVYTGCSDVCPTVTEALANAVEVARDTLGEKAFGVVTIGFDARNDSPDRMRHYAASRGIRVDGWKFLSADGPTIDRLASDLGFVFNPSPQGFDHMSQTTVIDTGGKVYRHIYGADFDPPHLVEPLKQVIFGKKTEMTSLEGLLNRVRLYCTLYDPASGKYRFDYSLFISIVLGGLSLALVGTVLVRALWRRRNSAHPA